MQHHTHSLQNFVLSLTPLSPHINPLNPPPTFVHVEMTHPTFQVCKRGCSKLDVNDLQKASGRLKRVPQAHHDLLCIVLYSLLKEPPTAYPQEWMKRHTGIDLTAFNTDGFDFGDTDGIYVHHSEVWNQDDCVCLKDNTKNAVVEHVSASGLGLTIGSIGDSYSLNVTFRDCVMRDTVKGLYLKFRGGGDNALIQDITYENIAVSGVSGWPIWIGPAQQSDSVEICAAHPCSLCWPEDPLATCSSSYGGNYSNIVMRNVSITGNSGVPAPGVIIGTDGSPMQGLVFDNVVVKYEDAKNTKHAAATNEVARADDWYLKEEYYCKSVHNIQVLGSTSPVPKCSDV